ncbi:MAG TPA: hypothetical protein VK747_03275, partial [Blastocatellia bacterium]|nr:hypothetical protein [Blastocatellia bacterium]
MNARDSASGSSLENNVELRPSKLKEVEQNYSNSSDSLPFRNRQRCCRCRDPQAPFETYTIDDSKSSQALENLVLLCEEHYEEALKYEQEFGTEDLIAELTRVKTIWEDACQAWRNSRSYILRIKQGDRFKDIQADEYDSQDGAFVGWYELDEGGTLYIDMKSDEFVEIDIRKALSDSEQYGDRSYFSRYDYEFDEEFTARKAGRYALLIRNRSSEKAEVDLNVSTFLSVARAQETALKELAAWVVTKREEQERVLAEPSKEYVPWTILPPGEHPFPQIMEYYENLQAQNQSTRYES